MVSKFSIAHCQEYGTPEVFRIFNISTKNININDLHVEYLSDRIYLNGDNINWEIILNDECYQVVRHYKGYDYIEYCELDNTVFRKVTRFDIGNNNDLVLDELTHEDFMFRRFLVTNKDDAELVRETFEREKFIQKKYNIRETYKKELNEDEINCNAVKRIIMPNNYYVSLVEGFYDENCHIMNGFIDIACCVNEPRLKVRGRIDNPEDALSIAIQCNKPSLIINFEYETRDVANINKHKVLISAIKDDRVIKINILNDINDKDNVKIIHDDFEGDNGGIKSTDIKIINDLINNCSMCDEYSYYLSRFLNKLVFNLEINEGIRTKDIDFFEAKLDFIDNYHYLALDIYEHLDYYKKKLEGDTTIVYSTLKKKL